MISKKPIFYVSFLVFVVMTGWLAWAQPAYSFGGGGGGDAGGHGGSCCIRIPPELEELAAELERSFAGTSQENLARQRWAGSLCRNHPCNGQISEEQAKDLLDSFAAREARRNAALVSWGGLGVAVLGLFLSIIGLRQSARNERDIGRLQARSD
ncbi:MAG: hypothetical protein AAFQ51_15430 [Pseudomonadota bacterium]